MINILKFSHHKEESNLENWNDHYSKLAGNEIHSIIAENSKFFQEFIGKSFAEASFTAHKKYNFKILNLFINFKIKYFVTLN